MMHVERELRAEEAVRVLLSDRQRELYMTSASFRAEVQELIRFVIPTMLRGIEAQAEEHDEARRRAVANLRGLLQPMPVNLKGTKL